MKHFVSTEFMQNTGSVYTSWWRKQDIHDKRSVNPRVYQSSLTQVIIAMDFQNIYVTLVNDCIHTILQARLQQYLNQEHSDYKLGLEKAEKQKIKLPREIKKKKKKHLFLFHWLTDSLCLCGSQQIVENF